MRFEILILLSSLLLSCKQRTYNAQPTGVAVKKNIATVDWPCSGTGKQHPAGFNSQEEYCEWTRNPVVFNGRGQKLRDGSQGAVNLQKACVFTTSFDQSRMYFLTQRVVGQDKGQGGQFWATQFNSYAYLVGGREPDTGIERTGIVQHCMSGQDCFAPNCIPDRASDPQICRALNQLGRRMCKVDINHEVAPVITAKQVAAGRHGDRVIKPQLSVRPTIAPHCWFVDDPIVPTGLESAKGESFNSAQQKTLLACDASALNVSNCDSLAPDVAAVVTLKIANEECLGSGGQTNPNPSPSPATNQVLFGASGIYCKLIAADGPANVRAESNSYSSVLAKLESGFEVYIRGYQVVESGGVAKKWASVQFEKGGKKFGAGDGVPAFIHESQFEKQCRK
jgi:hypothetical protein